MKSEPAIQDTLAKELNDKRLRPLTEEELAQVLNLPSSFVKDLRRKRKIPYLKLGYKTFRYELEKVRTALAKLEVRAI